jgi:hypothetical protein
MLIKRVVVGVLSMWLMLGSVDRAAAAPITGTLDTFALDVAMDGTDLEVSTFVGGSDILSLTGGDDFSGVPIFTSFGPLALDLTDILGSFTFGNATYGSFTPTSALISTQTTDLLVLVLLGTFTPGPALVGSDPTGVRLDVAVTKGGGEVPTLGATVALSTPTPTVPEPGMSAMLLLGGLTLARRLVQSRGLAHTAPPR